MINGKNLVVQTGSVVIGLSKTCKFTLNRSTIDTTTKNSGDWTNKEYSYGSAQVSVDGLWSYTTGSDQSTYGLETAMLNGNKLQLT